ncbi:MAG: hypothetical protein OXU51_10595 [Candidatus Poribacteria bacterium]|nr:hypothetical protein [Candidatus Poribacteria bacterium]
MFIRKYWLPISVFIVAIVGIGLYLLATQPPKEPIKIYKAVEPEKPSEQPTPEVPESETDTGGHFHADGTWHEGPHDAPVASEVPTEVETPEEIIEKFNTASPAMQLTYHTELLKSDPVEALRQQSKERGHWSADYLPDFPLDDTEAMEIARAEYDLIYYQYQTPRGQPRSPEYHRAARHIMSLLRAVNEKYPADSPDWHVRARGLDLGMFSWPSFPDGSDEIEHYRDYTTPSLVVRSHMYPELPELGEPR